MIMPPSTSSCLFWHTQYRVLSTSSSSSVRGRNGGVSSNLGLVRLEEDSGCEEDEEVTFLVVEEDFLLLLELVAEVDSFLVVEAVFFFFAGGGCDGSRDGVAGAGETVGRRVPGSGLMVIASSVDVGCAFGVGAGEGLGVSCSTFTAGVSLSQASAAPSVTLLEA